MVAPIRTYGPNARLLTFLKHKIKADTAKEVLIGHGN